MMRCSSAKKAAVAKSSSSAVRSCSTRRPKTFAGELSLESSKDDARETLGIPGSLLSVPLRFAVCHSLLHIPDLSPVPKLHARLLQDGRPAQPGLHRNQKLSVSPLRSAL